MTSGPWRDGLRISLQLITDARDRLKIHRGLGENYIVRLFMCYVNDAFRFTTSLVIPRLRLGRRAEDRTRNRTSGTIITWPSHHPSQSTTVHCLYTVHPLLFFYFTSAHKVTAYSPNVIVLNICSAQNQRGTSPNLITWR